jgi:hypothetical protein
MNAQEIYFTLSGVIFLIWLLAGSNSQTEIYALFPTTLSILSLVVLLSSGEINSTLYWITLIVNLIAAGIFGIVSIAGKITFQGNLFTKFPFHLFIRLGAPVVFIWTLVEMAT